MRLGSVHLDLGSVDREKQDLNGCSGGVGVRLFEAEESIVSSRNTKIEAKWKAHPYESRLVTHRTGLEQRGSPCPTRYNSAGDHSGLNRVTCGSKLREGTDFEVGVAGLDLREGDHEEGEEETESEDDAIAAGKTKGSVQRVGRVSTARKKVAKVETTGDDGR